MTKLRAFLKQAACCIALALCLEATGSMAAKPAEPSATACVKVRPEVRYGNQGYDHVVHLKSSCAKPALCSVSTNVNPEPIQATLKPDEAVEVVTFRGSPAREFVPSVSCVFVRRSGP